MRKLLITLALFAGAAHAQVTVHYVTQIESADVAASALNAALQAALREGDEFRLTSNPPEDRARFRVILRAIQLDGLSDVVSAYSLVTLLDHPKEGSFYIHSTLGYAGVDKAPEMARRHAKEIKSELNTILDAANPKK